MNKYEVTFTTENEGDVYININAESEDSARDICTRANAGDEWCTGVKGVRLLGRIGENKYTYEEVKPKALIDAPTGGKCYTYEGFKEEIEFKDLNNLSKFFIICMCICGVFSMIMISRWFILKHLVGL